MDEELKKALQDVAKEAAKEAVEEASRIESKKMMKKAGLGLAGWVGGKIFKLVAFVAVIILAFTFLNPFHGLKDKFGFDKPLAGHDLTLENKGIFGYTAADFSEVVLGKSKELKKLEVMSKEISGNTQISKTGLIKIKVFSKSQEIKYKGAVVYTVDLNKLNANSISYDKSSDTVTIVIPHVEQSDILVNEDDIEYGEVKKGMFTTKTIKLKPEEIGEVRKTAIEKMEEKLKEDNISAQADDKAKKAVLDVYKPIIQSVSSSSKLVIAFDDEV